LGGAFEQLLKVVGSLVGEMKGMMMLMNEKREEKISNKKESDMQGVSGVTTQLSRSDVLEEVRELNEREKRKCSIIMHGFGCECVDDAVLKFDVICEVLGLASVELSDVTKVGTSGLFRAKVMKDDERREPLTKAKELKEVNGYERVFVQRDLTFRPRQELLARRHAARADQSAGVVSPFRGRDVDVGNRGVAGGRGAFGGATGRRGGAVGSHGRGGVAGGRGGVTGGHGGVAGGRDGATGGRGGATGGRGGAVGGRGGAVGGRGGAAGGRGGYSDTASVHNGMATGGHGDASSGRNEAVRDRGGVTTRRGSLLGGRRGDAVAGCADSASGRVGVNKGVGAGVALPASVFGTPHIRRNSLK
jgi:hypothetical protein